MSSGETLAGHALSPRLVWLVGTMILLLAVVVRCLYLDKSLWCDEADSYIHATADNFVASARANVHPPLYFLLLRGATLAVDSFAGLRLLSVACGAATVALLLRTQPPVAGWIAGLLVACAPEMIYQSQELRHYALLNLLLLGALLCTLRLAAGPPTRGAALGLAGSLAAAAATHLTTGFMMAPLALMLLWSQWHQPIRRRALLATLFLPATLVLFFFHSVFLDAAKNLGGGNWWMGPATWGDFARAFAGASGWESVQWAADAVGRHVPFAGTILLCTVGAGVAVALWAAWFPRPPRLALILLGVALAYWTAIIAYSFAALSVFMPRILIPGLLPFFLSIALGVAEQPHAWRRRAGGVAIGAYALVGLAPWLWHFAWVPREDLRGLVEVVRGHRPADEVVIFVGGTDVAVDAYWPQFKRSPRLATISLLEPLPPQLDGLHARLAQRAPGTGALLVYRVDGYFYPRREKFDTLLSWLAREGLRPPESLWEHNFYFVQRLAPGLSR